MKWKKGSREKCTEEKDGERDKEREGEGGKRARSCN